MSEDARIVDSKLCLKMHVSSIANNKVQLDSSNPVSVLTFDSSTTNPKAVSVICQQNNIKKGLPEAADPGLEVATAKDHAGYSSSHKMSKSAFLS